MCLCRYWFCGLTSERNYIIYIYKCTFACNRVWPSWGDPVRLINRDVKIQLLTNQPTNPASVNHTVTYAWHNSDSNLQVQVVCLTSCVSNWSDPRGWRAVKVATTITVLNFLQLRTRRTCHCTARARCSTHCSAINLPTGPRSWRDEACPLSPLDW